MNISPKEHGDNSTAQEMEILKKRLVEAEQELWDLQKKQLKLDEEAAQACKEESVGALVSTSDGTWHIPPKIKELDSRSIFVGNVDYECAPEEVLTHFNSSGTVIRVTILTDHLWGHPKGYAFIEFESVEDAQNALLLDKTVLHGRQIKVTRKRTNIPGMDQYANDSNYGYGKIPRACHRTRYMPY